MKEKQGIETLSIRRYALLDQSTFIINTTVSDVRVGKSNVQSECARINAAPVVNVSKIKRK
jgi:hypothetical protein